MTLTLWLGILDLCWDADNKVLQADVEDEDPPTAGGIDEEVS
tara:strand:- start:504 stop:629 length:126 start_codon:yes stop_codon:yes gene_type:complete